MEVYLNFLLIGHTHEDIDQRFSVISSKLKCHNIDSIQELLELIQKGAFHTEDFTTSRHLEYVGLEEIQHSISVQRSKYICGNFYKAPF